MQIDEKMAELVGILLGDGNIYYSPEKRTYRFVVTGHSEDDFDYLTNYVSKLIECKFGKSPNIWKQKGKNSISIALYSRTIVDSLLSIGLSSGRKVDIEIPKAIYDCSNAKVKAAILRGLADTDFSMVFHKGSGRQTHCYPIITGSTISKKLAHQMANIISDFGIKVNLKRKSNNRMYAGRDIYELWIYGYSNLEKWMTHIGFSNSKHASKIILWKRLGYCPPKTHLNERLSMINKWMP